MTRVEEVARGLAELHARGLIHRDVKPSNIVLEHVAGARDCEQPAVLVDFGLVRSLDPGLTDSSLRATPPYASPEQLMGKKVDARTDVFSLGVSLHDLLSARLPEQRSRAPWDGLEPLGRIVPGADRDLEAILARATEPESDLRYPDATGLAADLRAWLEGEPVSVRQLRGVEALRRWVRRNPARILRWAVRGVALALLVGLLLMGFVSAVDVITAARRAGTIWSTGEILSLKESLSAIPPWLDGLLLDEELERRADSLRSLSGDDPLIEVILEGNRVGPSAAVRRAAQYLERDGLTAHPQLAGFLLRRLRSSLDPAAEADAQSVALQSIMMLFHDRPDASSEDVEASRGLREELIRVLERAEVEDRLAAFALTALAGCGVPEQVPDVLARIEARPVDGSEDRMEEIRLGLQCIAAIVRRAHERGDLDAILGLQLPALLSRVAAVLAVVDRIAPSGWESMYSVELDLFMTMALAGRAAGAPVEGPVAVQFIAEDRRWLAAMRDPELHSKLERGELRLIGADDFKEYGELTGLWGDSSLHAHAKRLIRDLPEEQLTITPDQADAQYVEGLQAGCLALLGAREASLSDADCRLREFLRTEEAPLIEPECDEMPTVEEHIEAVWDFTGPVVLIGGATKPPAGRCVRFERGGFTPGPGYARLAPVPSSELRLPYFHSAENHKLRQWAVRVTVVKAIRSSLPRRGDAELIVGFDGEPSIETMRVREASARTSEQAFRPDSSWQPGERTLILDLSPASNTSVRILRVEIISIPLDR